MGCNHFRTKKKKKRVIHSACIMAVLLTLLILATGCGKGDGKEVIADNGDNDVTSKVTDTYTEASDKVQKTSENVKIGEALAQQKEERVRALYTEKETIEEAVRTLVAKRMENTSFAQSDAIKEYDIQEVQIDELTGKPIMEDAAKAVADGLVNGKSAEEVLDGLVSDSGLSDYLLGAAADKIEEATGVDIFAAQDFLDKWKNIDDTPVVLLDNIVEDHQQDISYMDKFLQRDVMSSADIFKISQIIYRIHVREGEIADISGENASDSSDDYVQLERLARQHASVVQQLLMYADLPDYKNEESLSDDELEQIKEKQKGIAQAVSEWEDDIELGRIAVCYDAAGFMEAQEDSNQNDLIFNTLTFGLVDQMNTIQEDVQQKRSNVYGYISDYQEESYAEVAEKRETVERQFGLLKWISCASDDDLYFVKAYLDYTDWENEWGKCREELASVLLRYQFDMNNAYTVYDCMLSQKQDSFINTLEIEIKNVDKMISQCGTEDAAGYSDEEKLERYRALIVEYADMVDYMQVRSVMQMPGFENVGEKTVYGVGRYAGYYNKGKPILVIELSAGQHVYSGEGYRCFFDRDGNLLYTRIYDKEIFMIDGKIASSPDASEELAQNRVDYAYEAYSVFR